MLRIKKVRDHKILWGRVWPCFGRARLPKGLERSAEVWMVRGQAGAIGRKTCRAVGLQRAQAVKHGTSSETARHAPRPNLALGIESPYPSDDIFRSLRSLALPALRPHLIPVRQQPRRGRGGLWRLAAKKRILLRQRRLPDYHHGRGRRRR
jgi:hypothetical protein